MSPALSPDDPRHGKYSTYKNHGCRCDRCKAANAERTQARRLANPDVAEAHRATSRAWRAKKKLAKYDADLAAKRLDRGHDQGLSVIPMNIDGSITNGHRGIS